CIPPPTGMSGMMIRSPSECVAPACRRFWYGRSGGSPAERNRYRCPTISLPRKKSRFAARSRCSEGIRRRIAWGWPPVRRLRPPRISDGRPQGAPLQPTIRIRRSPQPPSEYQGRPPVPPRHPPQLSTAPLRGPPRHQLHGEHPAARLALHAADALVQQLHRHPPHLVRGLADHRQEGVEPRGEFDLSKAGEPHLLGYSHPPAPQLDHGADGYQVVGGDDDLRECTLLEQRFHQRLAARPVQSSVT